MSDPEYAVAGFHAIPKSTRVSPNFGSDSRPKGDRLSEGKSEASKASPLVWFSTALAHLLQFEKLKC